MLLVLILLTIILLALSVRSLWLRNNKERKTYFSWENIVLLLLIYATVLIGFGLLYVMVWIGGHSVLQENGVPVWGSFIAMLKTSMYFSAITLLSVGYGDITPIGIGRWIAAIEAMLGYVMPYAFVVRTVIDFEKK